MTIALICLLVAAAFGSFLALGVAHGRSNGWKVPLAHGLIGIGGLIDFVLTLSVRHAPAARGLAGFGPGAAVLLGLALLFGLLVFTGAWQGRRPSGFVIGTHALLAIGGIVMVLAIVSLG